MHINSPADNGNKVHQGNDLTTIECTQHYGRTMCALTHFVRQTYGRVSSVAVASPVHELAATGTDAADSTRSDVTHALTTARAMRARRLGRESFVQCTRSAAVDQDIEVEICFMLMIYSKVPGRPTLAHIAIVEFDKVEFV